MDTVSQHRLQQNLAAASEDALVALSNRGLYRRALKDLEQNPTITIEESDKAILVRGPGWCVTMPPEGPAAARDDSGATGVTRFVLAATIYLQQNWLNQKSVDTNSEDVQREEAETEDANDSAVSKKQADADVSASHSDVIESLVRSTINDLTSWSGKGVFLKATAKLKSITEFRTTHSPALSFEFPNDNVRVLLMTDRPDKNLRKLLSQFKSTAPKSDLVFWVLLAVLALKRNAGEDLSNINVLEVEISNAIREDRLRVAEKCLTLLSSATISGLAHPSSRLIERFETCAIAAEAANFPRLARLLDSIANDIQLQIDRNAAADLQQMFDRVLVAYALCRAATKARQEEEMVESGSTDIIPLSTKASDASRSVRNKPAARQAELYGRSRSQYVPVGDLVLYGIGAYAWKTDSGYEGITALFWDPNEKRFLTASDSRGEGQDHTFDVRLAYTSPFGWKNSPSLQQNCRQHLRLTDAKLNWDGRLSSSESCAVEVLGPTSIQEIDFGARWIEDWSEAIYLAQSTSPIGLRLSQTTATWCIMKPTQWGKRWFDELEQEFVWELIDGIGQVVEMRVPWIASDEQCINFLETIKPESEKLIGVVGRLTVEKSRVSVYPLSFLSLGSARGETVLCPHFDFDRLENFQTYALSAFRRKPQQNVQSVHAKIRRSDDEGGLTTDLQAVPIVIASLLVDLEQKLHAAIESGVSSLNCLTLEWLEEAQQIVSSLGLESLSTSMETVLKSFKVGEPETENLFDSSSTLVVDRFRTKPLLATSEQAIAILDAAYMVRLAMQSASILTFRVEPTI
ncbi:MAG: hypothetical protein J0M26_17230 [Planctomycetes bacterium]|nr:hypothetical protein [Planctomycetota bacterium]